MKRGQKALLGILVFSIILSISPTAFTVNGTVSLEPGTYQLITTFDPTSELNTITGWLEANDTCDAWLTTNTTTALQYEAAGSIPLIPSVIWAHGGWAATIGELPLPDVNDDYYLYFGNINGGDWVEIVYVFDLIAGSGIPSFEILLALFGMLAVFGVFTLRKKSLL